MLMYIFVWILCSVQSEICYDNSGDGEARPGFCCNNHEKKNGICVECEVGYVSKDGLPCQPCSLGFWGRKCRDVCRCQQNESCNNIYGCVGSTTFVPENSESTVTKGSTHVLKTVDSSAADDKNDGIFLRSEIIIYSISAGVIAAIVALASCCLKNRRTTEHLNISKRSTPHHVQVSSDQADIQFNNDSSIYDSIDEDNIICNNTLRRSTIRLEHVNQAEVDQDVSSSSYFEVDVTDPSNEGQLDPYQPIPESDVHGFCLSTKESIPHPVKISLERSEKGTSDALSVNNRSKCTVGKQILLPPNSGLPV